MTEDYQAHHQASIIVHGVPGTPNLDAGGFLVSIDPGADHARLPRPRTPMSLGGLSLRQLAVGMWKRMEEHDAMTWAAAVAFYAMFATVPFLAIILVVVVLRLPDVSGAGHRTSGLGNLTVDQLDATLRSLFPNEAYILVKDQIRASRLRLPWLCSPWAR